jgi:hypothetical protein
MRGLQILTPKFPHPPHTPKSKPHTNVTVKIKCNLHCHIVKIHNYQSQQEKEIAIKFHGFSPAPQTLIALSLIFAKCLLMFGTWTSLPLQLRRFL